MGTIVEGSAVRIVARGHRDYLVSGYVIEIHNGYVHINVGNNREVMAHITDVEGIFD